jgi:hypothetical protein
MSPGDPEFEPLEPSLRSLLRRLSECPSAESLTGFQAGSLAAEEAAAIRDHVAICGVCDGLLMGLKEFNEPVADVPGWAGAERRMRAKVFPRPRWRAMLLHPAMAYGCAVLAVAAALWPRHQPATPAPLATSALAMESVRTLDLNVVRRGGVARAALAPQHRFILLSFLVDTRPGFRYAASLDGGPAKDVVSDDGKGNFSLLFSRDALRSGQHRLTVTEANAASRKTERSIEFPFEL